MFLYRVTSGKVKVLFFFENLTFSNDCAEFVKFSSGFALKCLRKAESALYDDLKKLDVRFLFRHFIAL